MSPLAQPLFAADLRVAMGDVDAARIIYFVTPMRWKEWLFTGWLQSIDRPLIGLIDEGYAVPTVVCRSEYFDALRLDDNVRGELYSTRLGRSSFEILARFVRIRDGQLCAEVASTHAWSRVGHDSQAVIRSEAIPTWMREPLQRGLIEPNGEV